MKFSLSIIMTLHKEGIYAKKSIKNIKAAIGYARRKKQWKNIQFIVVLDRPDDETRLITENFLDFINVIELVNYGEPSSSRNHGIKLASGDFVLLIDGDDLFSLESIFVIGKCINEFYQTIDKIKFNDDYNQHIAVFPNRYIEFPEIYVQKFCNSNDILKQNMLFHHSYVARICCLREILITNPVRVNNKPYGFEDWDLNNRLLSKGMSFRVAEGYNVFYRKKATNSVLTQHIQEKCIVRNSDLYKINSRINEQEASYEKEDDKTITLIQKIKKSFNYYPKELEGLSSSYLKYADFLIKNGEKKLSINRFVDGSYLLNTKVVFNESLCYFELRDFLMDADIVLFIPWITLGGADRLVLEYVKTLTLANINVKVVTTIKPGERISKLECSYLNIGSENNKWATITEDNLLHVILKAIINSNVRFFHIINSEPMLKVIKYYSQILNEYDIRYIVTFFGLDIDLGNTSEYIGFPIWYKEVYNNAKCIIGDNQFWYTEYKKINNNVDFKYKKLFSPVTVSNKYLPRVNRVVTNNILWASRICNQKLFGVFAEIVRKMPEKNFYIYGSSPDDPTLINQLQEIQQLQNVKFLGSYSSLDELNLEKFDIYLYTALFDGIPTILLDMINNCLPVVASNVGGISEVFGNEYPLFVSDVLNYHNYIEKINLFYKDTNYYNEEIMKIKECMLKMHNYENFSENYLEIIRNYLFNT